MFKIIQNELSSFSNFRIVGTKLEEGIAQFFIDSLRKRAHSDATQHAAAFRQKGRFSAATLSVRMVAFIMQLYGLQDNTTCQGSARLKKKTLPVWLIFEAMAQTVLVFGVSLYAVIISKKSVIFLCVLRKGHTVNTYTPSCQSPSWHQCRVFGQLQL